MALTKDKLNCHLSDGYEIRHIPEEEFNPPREYSFEKTAPIFNFDSYLSEAEKNKLEKLRENMGNPFVLRLGIFKNDELTGWHFGKQISFDSFYMQNSVILPEHRRKGLYTALLKTVIEISIKQGFQRVTSRHIATNNHIIIPKLKAGFVITNLEINDVLGITVQLTFYSNEVRRKMMDYRVGHIFPDNEIKEQLRFP